jgi:hypothetical protein
MPAMMPARDAQMFSDEAWDAGWQAAQRLGLTVSFEPLLRPVTKADVDAIVSAVANHGIEELHAEQLLLDGPADLESAEVVEGIRGRLSEHLAIEAIRNGCVMITLPREIIDHPEAGATRMRLIVPVRRIAS